MAREEKRIRIEEKINTINNLYDLAFETIESNLINVKEFKIDLSLDKSDVSLMKATKIIKKQIAVLKNIYELYSSHDEIQDLIFKLHAIHNAIISLLKEEYRNYRNKYEFFEI